MNVRTYVRICVLVYWWCFNWPVLCWVSKNTNKNRVVVAVVVIVVVVVIAVVVVIVVVAVVVIVVVVVIAVVVVIVVVAVVVIAVVVVIVVVAVVAAAATIPPVIWTPPFDMYQCVRPTRKQIIYSSIFLEKLTVAKLVKKQLPPPQHETRSLCAVVTRTHLLSVRCILILSFHLLPDLPSGLSHHIFRLNVCIHFAFSHTCHTLRPSNPP